MKKAKVLQKLQGGDLRSIGRADEVVTDILRRPTLFAAVFEGMLCADSVIRMRSADAIEKVSRKHPEYLQPFKKRLIDEVAKIDQQEIRWHVAQMFSYLDTTKKERDAIVRILFSYIDESESKIVKTFAMQSLANFAARDEKIKSRIVSKLKQLVKTGSPAMKSRGKKLLKQLS